MRAAAALVLALALAACSSAPAGSAPAAPRSSRDLITREQIEALNATDAYEVVQRIRSEYLRGRGSASINRGPDLAVVYIDGVKRGGPEALKGFRTTEIQEIRFISGTDATTRYGTDHGGGAIELKTRQGKD